jgi:predicted ATPase/DNA-binding CsgD family transcriptional regulator
MVAHNLPAQLTPFVGRVKDLDAITSLLVDPACRLLTLVGAGGIGKTRLALEIASQALALNGTSPFADGIYFVALQPLAAPDFIVPTIADAIRFQFYSSDEPKQQLLRHLQDKAQLLVVDNYEHLLDGAPILSEILAAAPGVKVLTTSRESLNLQEEWVYVVQGMAYPETGKKLDGYSAIQLFNQSARRIRPDFSLSDEATGVIRICSLVGGMPLALELASAWVRAMSCSEIADEIQRGLDILETPARNVPARHRNMRAVLEHSWSLLSEVQRDVFQRLSVFRGSFTREAAQVVTGASLRTLSALVDKSWLRWDATLKRYDLHELLRQYGEEQLRDKPEAWQTANEIHCQYYARFVEAQWPRLTGSEYVEAKTDIEVEYDNIRAGWNWAVEYRCEDEINAGVKSLWILYDTGGHWFREGEQAFDRAASALAAGAVYARVRMYQGALCFSLVQFEKGMAVLEESLPILRSVDAREDIAFCLLQIGMNLCEHKRDVLKARVCFHQGLEIYRELEHAWGIAYTLSWLGISHYGEAAELGVAEGYDRANECAHEGYAIFQRLNNSWGLAVIGLTISSTAQLMGEYEFALRLSSESYRLFQDMRIPWGVPFSLFNMGEAACGLERYADAQEYALRALRISAGHRPLNHTMLLIHLVAESYLGLGETEKAYELLAVVARQRDQLGLGGDGVGLRLLAKLDEDMLPHLRAAVERGRLRDLEAALEEVISDLSREVRAYPAPQQPLVDPLTERELEILQLIAEGLSNRAIADQLFLALGTVKFYNNQIFSKLSVASRTQAIVRARELNLLN